MSDFKVTDEMIDDILARSVRHEFTLWGKEYIVCVKLPNGFTLLGRAACVNPANFDDTIGRQIAYEDVVSQLWKLEGYLMQQRFADSSIKKSENLSDLKLELKN